MIPWFRVAPNLSLGDSTRPFREEFDYVLTISGTPPRSDDGLRHRHMSVPDGDQETNDLLTAASSWVGRRWQGDKSVLVQSPGFLWAELVLAAFFIDLGASADEAIVSLRRARPQALSEQSFRNQLLIWRVANV